MTQYCIMICEARFNKYLGNVQLPYVFHCPYLISCKQQIAFKVAALVIKLAFVDSLMKFCILSLPIEAVLAFEEVCQQ